MKGERNEQSKRFYILRTFNVPRDYWHSGIRRLSSLCWMALCFEVLVEGEKRGRNPAFSYFGQIYSAFFLPQYPKITIRHGRRRMVHHLGKFFNRDTMRLPMDIAPRLPHCSCPEIPRPFAVNSFPKSGLHRPGFH